MLYDPQKKSFVTIPIQIVDKQEGIDASHPLVFDTATGKAKAFPAVDKDKKIVTIYSGARNCSSPSSRPGVRDLPASAWDSGDEIRVYYKEDGKALRLMNITKTNIFKR